MKKGRLSVTLMCDHAACRRSWVRKVGMFHFCELHAQGAESVVSVNPVECEKGLRDVVVQFRMQVGKGASLSLIKDGIQKILAGDEDVLERLAKNPMSERTVASVYYVAEEEDV